MGLYILIYKNFLTLVSSKVELFLKLILVSPISSVGKVYSNKTYVYFFIYFKTRDVLSLASVISIMQFINLVFTGFVY